MQPITIFGSGAMRRRKLTNRALAEALGVHEVTVSRYKIGVILPPLPLAREIAMLLGIPLDELYFKAESRSLKRHEEKDKKEPA